MGVASRRANELEKFAQLEARMMRSEKKEPADYARH